MLHSALLTNFRQGCKGLPKTNTIAYYEHSFITYGRKSFLTLGPGVNIKKHFNFLMTLRYNKLDCLCLAILSTPVIIFAGKDWSLSYRGAHERQILD